MTAKTPDEDRINALEEAARIAEKNAEYMRHLRDQVEGESGVRCDARARVLDSVAAKIRDHKDPEPTS